MGRPRWIIAVIAALVSLAMGSAIAFADGGPHGGYDSTTDGCAGCHRAHTAPGANLLRSTSTYALCMECHGVLSGGSNADVQDGRWVSGNSPLKGGGFGFATMNVNWSSAASAAVTSKHSVSGMSGYASDTMWGSGNLGDAGAGQGVSLQCITCHNPHGRAASGTATYRILRPIPNSAGGSNTILGVSTTPVTVTDVTAPSYVISDTTTSKYYGQTYAGVALTALSDWCARCHTRIHAASAGSPGDTPSVDPIYKFRHPTNGSSVDNNYASSPNSWTSAQVPACLTCHVAHGSTAAMGTNSAAIPKPGGVDALDGSLLRVNNRGVCELCHNK
jgi:predicted CXXCH cytochrome family protein